MNGLGYRVDRSSQASITERIIAVQESRKLKDSSLLDKLILTVKERREKQFRVSK